MIDEPEEKPDPIDAPTVQETGIVRAQLDNIRSAGMVGEEIAMELLREQDEENEEGEDGLPDVTNTPYLAELERKSQARARHARRWRPRFLQALRLAPFAAFAARATGINPKTAALHRERDPIFAEACQVAEDAGAALVLAGSWASAVDGDLEPVFFQGVEVGRVRKYDTRIRAMFLKGMFPTMFDRGQKVNMRVSSNEHTTATGELDDVKVHDIVTRLSPLMGARHLAMLRNERPPELPTRDGFIRLDQIPAADQSQNATGV